MDEKFSVSLELQLDRWKSQLEKVKKGMQSFGQTIKSGIVLDDRPLKNMTAQQEILKKQIVDIQQTLVMAQQDTKLFSPSEVLEMRAELEKLEGQLNSTTRSSNAFKNVGENISQTLEKGMSKAKRFTLSLFGIHSIYRMLSRASSAYLAQDQETTNKIQAAWIGLGSVFAPLLQMVADFAIRAVSYLNIFIKALTGSDFLLNAMSKSANKANKSVGKLSKTLAGFDEITNLDDKADGGGIDTSWITPFKNAKLNPELEKAFESFGKTVKEIWNDYLKPFFDYFDFSIKDMINIILGIGMIIDLATGNWVGLIIKAIGFIITNWDLIKVAVKNVWDTIISIFKTGGSIIVGILSVPINIVIGLFNGIVKSVKNIFDGIKTTFNGIITFITGIFSTNWKKAWEGVKLIFKGIVDTLVGIFTTPLNLVIGAINTVIRGLNKIKIDLPDWLGGKKFQFNIKEIGLIGVKLIGAGAAGGFAQGSNYIPNDQLAMIHQGEAVIPKKFNSREYFGMGNDDTNALLEKLIDRVEKIEVNPYTTIKDVGTASVNYINNQNRIMGRGVI